VLRHYFGAVDGEALLGHPGLAVHAGDLRREGFGQTDAAHARIADGLDAIFHSAANVNHFGHYEEFHADNVASTVRLLELARAASAAFHLMSTISVCGAPPEDGFRLFTEDDQAPQADANYYVRTKQEAEQLVLAARAWLPNASIHRVGNLVFPAGDGARQRNIGDNAFFRHVGALLRLGAVPDDSHVWMCHVDVVARGVLLLAESAELRHSTHHLEHARRDTLADIVTMGGLPASDFGQFIEHLQSAIADPDAATALAETMENMGLYRGRSPQARGRRLEVATDRTQALLTRLGLAWPSLPRDGVLAMLEAAALVFPINRNAEVEPTTSC
jgi:nucleoside-diphosphate-sugar epimerase